MKDFHSTFKMLSVLMMIILALSVATHAQDKSPKIDYEPFNDNTGHWYSIADKGNMVNPMPGKPRYKPTEVTAIGDNMILFQKANGGWPKNYDFFAILTDEQKDSVRAGRNDLKTTFDNGNTYTQIAALSIVYTATKIDKYKQSALRGIDYVLAAQFKNGGWPQYYPLNGDYSRHITFNDGAYEGIMQLLKNILDNEPNYTFIDNKYRDKIKTAYDKGLDCILKTQINDDGKPTAWCQQYDEVTLQPAWARKFEPASICDGESSGVVLFLMQIDHPSKPVIDAIQNAVEWFQQSEILNTKVNTIPAERMVTPFRVSTTDKVVVNDPSAPPIWTRYYELKTHRPIFCNRDSKIVYSLAEVARERRDGYAWYTYAPQKVLNKYTNWQKKWAPDNDVLKKL